MKRWIGIGTALALLALMVLSGRGSEAQAQPPGPPERFLVFTTGVPAVNQAVRDATARAGGQTLDEVRVKPGLEFLVVRVPGAAVATLVSIPGVREVSLEIPPKPVHDPIEWGVSRIEADCVWGDTGSCQPGIGSARRVHVQPGTVAGAGVTVAIVDTGVRMDNPDLSANLSGQPHADCTVDGQECQPGGGDTDGHGTHVAGIVAAAHNDILVIGVSPQSALLSLKCLDDGTFWSCLRAVRYAAGLNSNGEVVSAQRAKVVNMSWGWAKKLESQCPSCVETINTIMEEAWARGLLPVAAAGNDGNCGGSSDNVIIPARLAKPLAVAATNSGDGFPCWSSTGPSLDLAAPGVNINSTLGTGTGIMSGTSMAAPHVAGVGALVWSKESGLTNAQVRARLLSTAQDLSVGTPTGEPCGNGQIRDTWSGCGLVRADWAVNGTIPPTAASTVPAAPSSLTASAVSSSQIDLAWTDNSNNEDGFKIERSTDGTNFAQIATVGPNVTSYSNTDLTASTTYYYRVRAYNSAGDSAYSNTASAPTSAGSGGGVAVSTISPTSIPRGGTINDASIGGSGFASGASVTFVNGSCGQAPTATVNSVSLDGTSIAATVSHKGGGPAKNCTWDVKVTNPDGSSGVLVDGFTVTP